MDFDGVTIMDGNIEPILREAAHRRVPARDVEASQNPASWALALVRALADSPLKDSLRRALARLVESSDLDEVAFAVEALRTAPIVDGKRLWELFFVQTAANNGELANLIASTLITLSGRGQLAYDDRARDLLSRQVTPRGLFDKLLSLAGAHDRDWLLQNPQVLIGADADDTAVRIGEVASSLGSDALERFGRELARRTTLPPTAIQTISEMVAARRSAGV